MGETGRERERLFQSEAAKWQSFILWEGQIMSL